MSFKQIHPRQLSNSDDFLIHTITCCRFPSELLEYIIFWIGIYLFCLKVDYEGDCRAICKCGCFNCEHSFCVSLASFFIAVKQNINVCALVCTIVYVSTIRYLLYVYFYYSGIFLNVCFYYAGISPNVCFYYSGISPNCVHFCETPASLPTGHKCKQFLMNCEITLSFADTDFSF